MIMSNVVSPKTIEEQNIVDNINNIKIDIILGVVNNFL